MVSNYNYNYNPNLKRNLILKNSDNPPLLRKLGVAPITSAKLLPLRWARVGLRSPYWMYPPGNGSAQSLELPCSQAAAPGQASCGGAPHRNSAQCKRLSEYEG